MLFLLSFHQTMNHICVGAGANYARHGTSLSNYSVIRRDLILRQWREIRNGTLLWSYLRQVELED